MRRANEFSDLDLTPGGRVLGQCSCPRPRSFMYEYGRPDIRHLTRCRTCTKPLFEWPSTYHGKTARIVRPDGTFPSRAQRRKHHKGLA